MRLLTPHPLLVFGLCALLGCNGNSTAGDTTDGAGAAAQEADARPAASSPAPPDTTGRGRILFLGDSITAGYGLEPSQAFPALIQERIDSLGLPYEAVNAGVSGETSAGGLGRIEWVLQRPIDVLVVELGGNDGLRGIPPEATKKNLKAIIDRTQERYPTARIILAGMQIPPNFGQVHASRFREIYPEIAREENVELIPFVLEGVGGVRELNLDDGIHPTARGHRIVAENVWEVLGAVLQSETARG